MRALLLIAAAALLSACATYTDPMPGVRYPSSPPHVLFNDCDRARMPEAVEAVVAVRESARELGRLRRWPPATPLVLCIVTNKPWVVCPSAGRPLAGCTEPERGAQVVVAVKWSPAGDWKLVEHDWRATLVHELLAAGALGGWLELPRPTPATEAQWVTGVAYKTLAKRARDKLR